MPIKRYKAEQIVTLLRQIEVEIANGKTTPQACKETQITVQTYYRWRKEYGGLLPRSPNKSDFTAVGSDVDSLTRRGTKTRAGYLRRADLRVHTRSVTLDFCWFKM